jgi:hypothetical protein
MPINQPLTIDEVEALQQRLTLACDEVEATIQAIRDRSEEGIADIESNARRFNAASKGITCTIKQLRMLDGNRLWRVRSWAEFIRISHIERRVRINGRVMAKAPAIPHWLLD